MDRDGSGDWARRYSGDLLEELPSRWRHTEAVAHRAQVVGEQLQLSGDEADVLIAAAYLHDIGYAASVRGSGFHPLDGAVHLEMRGHRRLARLVAHHSGARWEAELRGLGERLAAFDAERSVVADALTYCT
jgi:HD superfamily phosphodiesterase